MLGSWDASGELIDCASCPFVAIEGPCATGKSTLLPALLRKLQDTGREALGIREFADGFADDYISRVIDDEEFFSLGADTRTPISETLLFASELAYETEVLIRPNLGHKTILVDRYTDSLLAYQVPRLVDAQCMNERSAVEWVRSLTAPFAIRPDLTLMLTASCATIEARLTQRMGRVPAAGELRFVEQVTAEFAGLCRDDRDRCVVVAATDLLTEDRVADWAYDQILRITNRNDE